MCNTVKAGNATFTFIHLADAFIQSDLHCYICQRRMPLDWSN